MEFEFLKPKSKLHSILLAAIITLAVFLIALIIRNSKDAPLETALRLNTSGSRDVQIYEDKIFYIEGGSLHCVTTEGKFVWNLSVESGAGFNVTGKGVAVWTGTRVRLIDTLTGVESGVVSAGKEVLSAVVGDVYAAIVLAPEHSSEVLLTDLYGSEVDRLTDFEEVTVVDCGFFEGRELFWIMTLDSTGSLPTCKISTYKPGKRETGSITDMEQVIYKVMFRSNNICAVGTNYMRVYDYTGSEKTDEQLMVYGWTLEAVESNSENPLMLFTQPKSEGDEYAFCDVRCVKGKSEYMLHLNVECSALSVFNDTVYGFGGSMLVVADYKTGASNVYRMPVSVDSVLGITSDRTAVVASGSSIYMIKLPEN